MEALGLVSLVMVDSQSSPTSDSIIKILTEMLGREVQYIANFETEEYGYVMHHVYAHVIGHLVSDYLTRTMCPLDYCKQIDGRKYNGFSLITADLW